MEHNEKYSLLKRLQEGEEACWDYISESVLTQEIPRSAALGALERCLRKAIPSYQSKIANMDRAPDGEEGHDYWSEKMKEAMKAKRMIKEVGKGRQRTITYRGRSI